jgi:2-dehydro-3-deoxyphosphogluconate aldolase/(4S)-4-hydroxy-2-oxoglutarate aldolase
MRPRRPLPAGILQTRLLAIVRGLDPRQVSGVAGALVEAGVRALEVTVDSPQALDSIAMLRARHGDAIAIGAGTVLSGSVAARCIDAGAQFLVSPNVDAPTITVADSRGIPMLAGAMTPTEVVSAWSAGAAAVKLFPAATLGPGYLRALREPLREVAFVPTGGIDPGNVGSWLSSGAVAVAAAGWLIGDADANGVQTRAERLLHAAAES